MTECKVRVIRPLEDVFPKYQPTIGKIYDAKYCPGHKRTANEKTCVPASAPFCIIKVSDMPIVVRKGEFEIVGGNDNV